MNDIQIAQSIKLEPVTQIAAKAGISEDALEFYGKYKAKLDLDQLDLSNKPGNLILVTAMTPTKFGEGKSTVTVGLLDGLCRIGKKAMGCLREPSMGPVFGLKGGATGGGYSQVVPMEDINLHFTGDFHALTSANNLVAAMVDNSIYQGNPLNIDKDRVIWTRCVDMNDRTLRTTQIGLGSKVNGIPREDHNVITVATELMAILCLAKDLMNLKEMVGQCIVAYTVEGKPVTVKDLKADGAVAVLLKDAIKPNLVQTLEHNPVLIHGGPFANIAHGCNSLIATQTALKLADYVVTEAGFGSDLGAEKFLDIKCRKGQLTPNCIVIVATIRALKHHGGCEDTSENIDALLQGCQNLAQHVNNMKSYGVPVIVALNHFSLDTDNEIKAFGEWCDSQGYLWCLSDGWAFGGKGCEQLANRVVELSQEDNNFHYLYNDDMPLKEKIETLATNIYKAKEVEFSQDALENLADYQTVYGDYPICVAKTQNSFSDDAKLLNAPKDYVFHIRDVKVNAGAKFIVAYAGNILTMPGLPKVPAAEVIDIDEQGKIVGLF